MGTFLQALGTVNAILALLFATVLAATAISLLIMSIKRKAVDQSLKEYRNLADARLATITQERDEKEHAQRELAAMEHHLGECERLRNDFAANNLRLNARLTGYEKCINTLEVLCGRRPTNFDEPLVSRQ